LKTFLERRIEGFLGGFQTMEETCWEVTVNATYVAGGIIYAVRKKK
jgi:hypothetical protein